MSSLQDLRYLPGCKPKVRVQHCRKKWRKVDASQVTHLPVLVPDIWETRGTPPSREGLRPAPVAL